MSQPNAVVAARGAALAAPASPALAPRAQPRPFPQIPLGATLRVSQFIRHGHQDQIWARHVVGKLLSQVIQPHGSWFAHPKSHKLELHRLVLQKPDGEVTTLSVDERTRVQILDLPSQATTVAPASAPQG